MSQFDNPYQSTGMPAGTPPGVKPDSYLVYAILSTICCCIPLGIVSIVYAAQVDSKWNAGDYAGALSASENAKKWAIIAAVTGLILGVLSFVVQILMGLGAAAVGGNAPANF